LSSAAVLLRFVKAG